MNKKYPQNLTEAIVSAIPNCTTMVLGMMTLNLWIYGVLTWENFWATVPFIYGTAFCLDFFFVGPMVTRFVRKFNIYRYTPFIRVGVMAAILTFLAPLIETGFVVSLGRYVMALPRNYIAALLLQILVAMPLGLLVLARYRKLVSSLIVSK